jgi:DNA-binding beta-propeller fold protein YncE
MLCAAVCLLVALGSAQWLERQVVTGDTFGGITLGEGSGIVVNPISGNVYIESDPIQIFNPVTREKLRAPDVAGRVVFFPASNKGYIFDESESALIVDAAADTVIGAAALPFIPDLFVCNSVLNRLYLVHGSTSEIVVFDPAGDSILDTIEVGGTVRSLLVDSTRNRIYVGTNLWELDVIDCPADTVMAEVEIDIEYIDMMALSTTAHKVYCAGTSDTALVVMSTDSLRSVGSVQLGDELEMMVTNPVAARLYCSRGDTVFVVDCSGDTVRTVIPARALSIAVSTLSGRSYIGRGDSAAVLAVDTADTVIDVLRMPAVPTHGVPALTYWYGSNELYGVTSPGDLAFIIDASTDTIAGTLNYAAYLPRQMVHNPAGNKLYLLCPGHDEIVVMDSTFSAPKHILGGATSTYGRPVLNPALNRLYVADGGTLRVIDCNSDLLVQTHDLYGVSRSLAVFVPYLNKIYIFSTYAGTSGDSMYVYDCFRDKVSSIFNVTDDVPCAVYDPRSNRVFFACDDAPTVRAIDPETDSVVKTFDLVGGSANGQMALNPDLGRLYYTDQSPRVLFTIDVLADSVISIESLPGSVDTMFLNRRLQKLYLCVGSQTLVFDCARDTIVGTIGAGFSYSGLMDERNDKLFLRYGAVVDCRYDSVVTRLDSINPRSMAWDAIDNRVFQATTSHLYVYRDDPYGIEEQKVGKLGPALAVLGNPARASLRLRLQIPPGQTGVVTVYDAAGRRVHSSSGLRTSSFDIDVRSLSAGIYFARLKTGTEDATAKVIVER